MNPDGGNESPEQKETDLHKSNEVPISGTSREKMQALVEKVTGNPIENPDKDDIIIVYRTYIPYGLGSDWWSIQIWERSTPYEDIQEPWEFLLTYNGFDGSCINYVWKEGGKYLKYTGKKHTREGFTTEVSESDFMAGIDKEIERMKNPTMSPYFSSIEECLRKRNKNLCSDSFKDYFQHGRH